MKETFTTRLKAFFDRPYSILWIGAVAVCIITTLEFLHDGAENYIDFRDATINFFNGISSYDEAYVHIHGCYFLYSPVFHYLFAPFAMMPYYLGGYMWNLFSWVVFFFAIKTLPGELGKHTTAMFAFLILFVMQSVFCFQYNIIVCSIFLLAFTLLERDKAFWAVLLIMLSATTKIYGAVELALLLCYPKIWRNIGYCIVCGAALLLLPITKLGIDGLIPWYLDWIDELTIHTKNTTIYFSLVWAQPIRAIALPNMRIFQIAVLLILGGLFFACKRLWTSFQFKTGALATLMIYIVIMSEAAEFTTHMISATGFALWYFLKPTHNRAEKVMISSLWVLFGCMPIDIFFPTEWCIYIHRTLWIGVWIFTIAWGYLVVDTIKPRFQKTDKG